MPKKQEKKIGLASTWLCVLILFEAALIILLGTAPVPSTTEPLLALFFINDPSMPSLYCCAAILFCIVQFSNRRPRLLLLLCMNLNLSSIYRIRVIFLKQTAVEEQEVNAPQGPLDQRGTPHFPGRAQEVRHRLERHLEAGKDEDACANPHPPPEVRQTKKEGTDVPRRGTV